MLKTRERIQYDLAWEIYNATEIYDISGRGTDQTIPILQSKIVDLLYRVQELEGKLKC